MTQKKKQPRLKLWNFGSTFFFDEDLALEAFEELKSSDDYIVRSSINNYGGRVHEVKFEIYQKIYDQPSKDPKIIKFKERKDVTVEARKVRSGQEKTNH